MFIDGKETGLAGCQSTCIKDCARRDSRLQIRTLQRRFRNGKNR